MGETRVDLLRLLQDLGDAYTGPLEETILTEIVGNARDSGAGDMSIAADSVARTLTVIDDGKGMGRSALDRYHDLAVTSKRRGLGIGFAGVGIKLGLLVSEEVVTETKTARARTPLATSWRLPFGGEPSPRGVVPGPGVGLEPAESPAAGA
ncbi:MAG: ATP-binding protein [Gemmatimonadota bacterium]